MVLLPRGYYSHQTLRYPVIYQQGHFSRDSAFEFSTQEHEEDDATRQWRASSGVELGFEFSREWNADHFPRTIAVTLQHPTPFYDASYAVNSANDGPYGDAIMTELIPYIEQQFRIIREPYARSLTGGSTGGWESLALQLYHPDFFGSAWVLYPDMVDFRSYQLSDIYEDDNAFVAQGSPGPDGAWQRLLLDNSFASERPNYRTHEGQLVATVRQMSQLESVLGLRGRSGGIQDGWAAAFSPVGADGYPRPLWDKQTGRIDHEVARSMREKGYDLRAYAQEHWSMIGPSLVGKLHFYCGEMDNFYLNLAVYRMEAFLKGTNHPYYDGSFEYGRPLKGRGWQGIGNAELVRKIAAHTSAHAPPGSAVAWSSD